METPATTTQPTPVTMRSSAEARSDGRERPAATSVRPETTSARPEPVEGPPPEEPGYGHGV